MANGGPPTVHILVWAMLVTETRFLFLGHSGLVGLKKLCTEFIISLMHYEKRRMQYVLL